jgi:hypothetical protein
MNHFANDWSAGGAVPSSQASDAAPLDPIAEATHAIERVLAIAHEAGHHEAVRLLHAVTALLTAAPRH